MFVVFMKFIVKIMYRIHENPLTRFPEKRELKEDLGKWAVARLKSKREKAFAEELTRNEVGYYLPMVEKRTKRRDTGKLRKSICSLFPGYVAFVQSEKGKSKGWVLGSDHVAGIIEVRDQKQFVEELCSVQRILDEDLPIEMETRKGMKKGDPVRIVIGSLSGIEGEVIEWGNTAKVLLKVEMFGQFISVGVEPSSLLKV